MIESIRQYMLSIVAASVICSIISSLINKKTSVGAIIKLLSGIFLTICVLTPFLNLDFSSFTNYFDSFSFEANEAVALGTDQTEEAVRQCIKQQTESYILDKAASLEVDLTVEVDLSSDDPPVPENVLLSVSISPYAKKRITEIISEDLGIPKENQSWT